MKGYKQYCYFMFLVTINLLFVLTACESHEEIPLPIAQTPTETQHPTEINTLIPIPTHTQTSSPSPSETQTKTLILPVVTPVFIGTAIPNAGEEEINAENVKQLSNVAQWGKGNILGVAFSPSGDYFIVGSAFGFAIYNPLESQVPPKWFPFKKPFFYQNLYFSEDGQYILLDNLDEEEVYSIKEGKIATNTLGLKWIKTSILLNQWDETRADSLDGKMYFNSSSSHDEENWNVEFSVREVYDTQTGKLLFTLPDETIQVLYNDTHKPEGCDLSSFSFCGNVYDPSASFPYRVAFSPTNESLAILYRPPNLWSTNQFSTLRIYGTNQGKVLSMIGSFEKPIETFDYSPDGKNILVGFVDGSIQLWNIEYDKSILDAWHFNTPIIRLDYSYDSKYTIVQSPGLVEVRLSNNGSLRSRYQAVSYAISPVNNQLALGDEKGNLHIRDIDSGETVFNIQAHTKEIYALAFSPDGLRLTSSGEDCTVRNWDMTSGEFVRYLAPNKTNAYMEEFTESRIFIYYMKYIPNTNHIIGYGSWSRVVNWDANSGSTEYLIEPEPLEYFNGMVTLNPHFPEFLSIDEEGKKFYIDNMGYELDTGKIIGEYTLPENLAEGCASVGPISADGKLLFAKGYDSKEGQICILDTENYNLLNTINVLPEASVNRHIGVDWLYLSPTKKQLFIALSEGMIYVYQVTP